MKTLLICLATLPALAQQIRPAVANMAIGRRAYNANTPPQALADEHTKSFATQLGLSHAQAKQVRAAALAQVLANQALLRQHKADPQSVNLQAESLANQQAFEVRLAAICTLAQRRQRYATLALAHRLGAPISPQMLGYDKRP